MKDCYIKFMRLTPANFKHRDVLHDRSGYGGKQSTHTTVVIVGSEVKCNMNSRPLRQYSDNLHRDSSLISEDESENSDISNSNGQ